MIFFLLPLCVYSWNYQQNGEDWEGTCATGSEQSPINIDQGDTSKLGDTYSMLVYYYGIVGSRTVVNDGNTISLPGDYGYITITDQKGNDRKFLTDHIEFHMPSEHWFDGYPSQMEVQVFHTIDDSDYTAGFPSKAVVSIMIRPGDDNYFMAAISLSKLPASGSNYTLAATSLVNLLDICDPYDNYYFYHGSLNKPDCNETYLWYVFETEQMVSFAQMNYFSLLWVEDTSFSEGKGNIRETQRLHGRTVYYSSASSLALSLLWFFWS
ncbi:unnamed protein product [Blepharisma stoltei]|uniref:carbonic anhydrase n=1 Tax=Blepharisma stoltei TaxID=1481888 RepID=A0AAU9J7C9_9CILI|nr:unnamed protein product [Blepharisma stoltei]